MFDTIINGPFRRGKVKWTRRLGQPRGRRWVSDGASYVSHGVVATVQTGRMDHGGSLARSAGVERMGKVVGLEPRG